ncbi:MAG: AAA family ATPase [Synergistaceae bacterium]|jgi:DNA repair protein RecN (Recombination protein N)|nr:AAA family ATPase [Synergistaceae bacterium]
MERRDEMIDLLNVRGVGGIKSASLEFSGNFIAITGESGAGKSSLARSFEFISGRRAHASLIHSGCDEASVEALWNGAAPRGAGGGGLVTSRSINRAGKGRCQISGNLATVGQLAEVSSSLIQIQSQFAQIDLLDPDRQLELIDQTGGDELKNAKDRLAGFFPRMLAAEKEIIDLKKRKASLEERLEGAPERVRRIKTLALFPNCDREWEEELASIEKAIGEADRYENIVCRVNGGEANASLTDQIGELLRELYAVAPSEVRSLWAELGESALSNLQELFASVAAELGGMSREELESRCGKLEAKMGLLRRMKRETGLESAGDLLDYIKEVERDTKWVDESAPILEQRVKLASSLRAEASSVARNLRALRESAALEFSNRVNRHLSDLAMDDTRFSVIVNKLGKVRATGAESAAFMLAQGGLPPNPASKVASGGELSRMLIAIQASMEPDRVPGVLVFDEVEAGLGGRTALLAGQKLRELSKNCRTILITHEATIAAMADQHFVVRRAGDETSVSQISGEERALEIARMLAGSASREALDHARALLGAGAAEGGDLRDERR